MLSRYFPTRLICNHSTPISLLFPQIFPVFSQLLYHLHGIIYGFPLLLFSLEMLSSCFNVPPSSLTKKISLQLGPPCSFIFLSVLFLISFALILVLVLAVYVQKNTHNCTSQLSWKQKPFYVMHGYTPRCNLKDPRNITIYYTGQRKRWTSNLR